MGGLTTCASEAQVSGGKFYLVVSPIHPPLGGIKVLSRRRRGVSGGLRWGILAATCGEEARPGGNLWRQSQARGRCAVAALVAVVGREGAAAGK
jgi:hypothetical protein